MRKELLRISHVSMERDGEQLLDNLEFRMFAGEILVSWRGTGKARRRWWI